MARKKAFPLRIDPDLYEDLRRWADAEFRSVNGQIEYLLRDAVDRRRGRMKGAADHEPDPSTRREGFGAGRPSAGGSKATGFSEGASPEGIPTARGEGSEGEET